MSSAPTLRRHEFVAVVADVAVVVIIITIFVTIHEWWWELITAVRAWWDVIYRCGGVQLRKPRWSCRRVIRRAGARQHAPRPSRCRLPNDDQRVWRSRWQQPPAGEGRKCNKQRLCRIISGQLLFICLSVRISR